MRRGRVNLEHGDRRLFLRAGGIDTSSPGLKDNRKLV
jgi:hypothetical protein